MLGGRGGESGRERYALREYRRGTRTRSPSELLLPAAMIAAAVIAMPPDHDQAGRGIVSRRDDNDGCGLIPVVIRMRVARVIRSADHELPGEIRVTESEGNTDAGLRGSDAGRESKQESCKNENAFHMASWMPGF